MTDTPDTPDTADSNPPSEHSPVTPKDGAKYVSFGLDARVTRYWLVVFASLCAFAFLVIPVFIEGLNDPAGGICFYDLDTAPCYYSTWTISTLGLNWLVAVLIGTILWRSRRHECDAIPLLMGCCGAVGALVGAVVLPMLASEVGVAVLHSRFGGVVGAILGALFAIGVSSGLRLRKTPSRLLMAVFVFTPVALFLWAGVSWRSSDEV